MKLLNVLALALSAHPCCRSEPDFRPVFRPVPVPPICRRWLDPVDDSEAVADISGWVSDEADVEAEYWRECHPGCRDSSEAWCAAQRRALAWARSIWGGAIY